MSKFADTLRRRAEDREAQDDPLTYIVQEIAECDLPTASKAAIIKHIEDARAKHPYSPEKRDEAKQPLPEPPETRPNGMKAVADALDKLTKKKGTPKT